MSKSNRGGAVPRNQLADNDASVLAWDDQYRALHGRAHRKGPSRLGTPALTRHLAFWIPVGAEGDDFQKRRDNWVADVDWFLASFILNQYKSAVERGDKLPSSFNAKLELDENDKPKGYRFLLLRHEVAYVIADDSVQFQALEEKGRKWDARFETLTFRFVFEGVLIKMRAELHTEYFTLTFSAETDQKSQRNVTPPPTRENPLAPNETQAMLARDAIAAAFVDLANLAKDRGNPSAAPKTRERESAEFEGDILRVKEAVAFLYREFWEKLDDQAVQYGLWPTIPRPVARKHRRDLDLRPNARCHLRDVIGTVFVDFRGVVLSVREEAIEPPFDAPKRTSLSDYVQVDYRPDKEKQVEQIKLLDALLPVIDGARRAVARDDKLPAVEYAASAMHRGRAIYISALGPQPIWRKDNEPVCYLVATRHRHRWQIGRLLDRLHALGTLRVASLRDFHKLNDAGFRLRQIAQKLDKIDGAERDVTRDKWQRLSRRFREAVSERNGGEGGLQYRTDRALFYIDQFESEAHELDSQRIEGFQPYEAFVQRRVGQAWDYIRSLSRRCDIVAKRLNSLSNEVRANEEFAQTRELGKLLSFAEWTATVPVAYYGGYILERLLPMQFGEWLWSAGLALPLVGGWMPSMPEHEHPYLGCYMAAAGGAYFVWVTVRLLASKSWEFMRAIWIARSHTSVDVGDGTEAA